MADLLEERLGRPVRAARYAPGGYSWAQHVTDAHDDQHVLYRLLGPGSSDSWNLVVFQVGPLLSSFPSAAPVLFTS